MREFVIERDIFSTAELSKIKNKRGNSAIFICPFKGCHAVADADIQAAFIIAIKGYLYAKYWKEASEKAKPKRKEYYENLLEKTKEDTRNIIQSYQYTGKIDFIYFRGNKQHANNNS